MSNQEVENIELSIEQASKCIGDMEALNRLTVNKDFQRLILTNYFEKEASRLVLLKADDNSQDENVQKSIEHCLDAIGYFHQYLRTISQLGHMAVKAKEDDEATREEMLAEEVQ